MHNCIHIRSAVVSRTFCWHSSCPAPMPLHIPSALPPSGCASHAQLHRHAEPNLCLYAVFGILVGSALMQMCPPMRQVLALPPCGRTSHAQLHLHPGHGGATAHFWYSCPPCPNAAAHHHAVGIGPTPTQLLIPCAIASTSGAQLHLEPAVGIFFALPECRCTSQALCPHLVAHPMRNCICIPSTIVSICRFWHSCWPCPDAGAPPHAAGAGPAPMRLRIPCAIASASRARLFLPPFLA